MTSLPEKRKETITGASLVVLSIVLLFLSVESIERLDDVNREYERECDVEYRTIMGNLTAPEQGNCDLLLDTKSTRTLQFLAVLSFFLVTSLAGLATLLTPGEN
ncbi:MAG: hypothetical protein CMA88_02330 [Euryarchaeota archaeon]|nr:hypothetical protein [Euryarchaeota archaeon]|tara:strand:- start:201 stop:512 length:312 start_codon:yes stop_codon:yes gene_type:complete